MARDRMAVSPPFPAPPESGTPERSGSTVLLLVPAILALMLLAAHFLRNGRIALVALCLLGPLLLALRRPWVARLFEGALLVGAVVWGRTALEFVAMRRAMGQPFARLLVILGSVALLSALAALLFETRPLRRRYRLE